MILDLPFILETRRNHALEHATLHMLSRAHKGRMAIGASSLGGAKVHFSLPIYSDEDADE